MVMARFTRNGRLTGALMAQALSALGSSPRARAFYDAQRAAGAEHHAALRKLGSRLAGILHGCLKTRGLPTTSPPIGPTAKISLPLDT